MSLLFLFLLALQSYSQRNQIVETDLEENHEQEHFQNRISFLFFIDTLLVISCGLCGLLIGALSSSDVILIWLAAIISLSVALFIPVRSENHYFQRFLNIISAPLLRINLLVNRSDNNEKDLKVKELEQVLENSEGDATEEDQKMLEGIVKFSNTEVRQIMTLGSEMVAVNESESLSEIVEIIRNNGYSRMPVYNKRTEKIIGILHAKDLIAHLDKSNADWKPLLRPAFFVSESKLIIDLLEEFQQRKKHLAIAMDDTGNYTGVVTLQDVIAEIVGDIVDEFDEEEVVYSKLDDHNFIFEAKTPLSDLFKILEIEGAEFEETQRENTTIAGFLSELTQRIPRKNEKINFHHYLFTIEAADKRQVKRVKLTINK